MVGDDSASIKSEELLREQAHFDEAAEQRAKTLEKLDQLPKNTAHPGAAKAAVAWSRATMASIGNVDDPVAFGRTDNDEHETYYIGKHPIWDEGTELLVVSWKAPIATAFYSATAANPNGLERKRQFNMDRNSILDFADIIFGDLSEQLRPLLEEAGGSSVVGWVETYEQDDVLLRELGRNRTGRMVDIVATIQAAQFELVTSASEGLLIIEGGPGTGKTVVALHRVSWLLWPDESKKLLNPEDFLVVGPSATFMS